MLVCRKSLVKTGARPGMTRLLNFFRINDAFLLADLPGYGFARRSAAETAAFDRMLADYAGTRAQLRAVFFLMDGGGAWWRIIGIAAGFFALRLVLFVNNLKVYFREIEM